MFNALAVAMGGFSPSTWTPVHGWAASGGIYSIAVHGDRFVVVETDKVGSHACTASPDTAVPCGTTGAHRR